MKIIGFGLSGLVGTRVVQLLEPSFVIRNFSRHEGLDITSAQDVEQVISANDADWVFHFAAFTNVDAAETDRINGSDGVVYKINVQGTRNIAASCRNHRKRLLYISTDFVFDGQKDFYTETDNPDPISWYGMTKFLGEQEVRSVKGNLIIRISYPYARENPINTDFIHQIVKRLEADKPVVSPTDQIITPTYIDDLVPAISKLVVEDACGIYHVTGSAPYSAYEACGMIASSFGYDPDKIQKTTAMEYYSGKAQRPLHSFLKNDKITGLGLRMKTLIEGLALISKKV